MASDCGTGKSGRGKGKGKGPPRKVERKIDKCTCHGGDQEALKQGRVEEPLGDKSETSLQCRKSRRSNQDEESGYKLSRQLSMK